MGCYLKKIRKSHKAEELLKTTVRGGSTFFRKGKNGHFLYSNLSRSSI